MLFVLDIILINETRYEIKYRLELSRETLEFKVLY